MNIIEMLTNRFEELPPAMQKLADYIISNHKKAPFFNATELARAAHVSEATVTRLAYALNMKGYQELRQAMQNHLKDRMDLPKYESNEIASNVLHKVIAMERSILDEMQASICLDNFNKAVDLLYKAKRILIVGMHYNQMPASYAAYFLAAFREKVRLIDKLDLNVFDQIQTGHKTDVVLTICTARYPKASLEAVSLLKSKGATIIAVTDSSVAPITQKADLSLIVPMKFISYIDPYGAVMVLLHALITGVFLKNRPSARKRLKSFNDFMDQNGYNSIASGDVTELL